MALDSFYSLLYYFQHCHFRTVLENAVIGTIKCGGHTCNFGILTMEQQTAINTRCGLFFTNPSAPICDNHITKLWSTREFRMQFLHYCLWPNHTGLARGSVPTIKLREVSFDESKLLLEKKGVHIPPNGKICNNCRLHKMVPLLKQIVLFEIPR